ncbi:hypothetical protein [Catenuloplanes atrovinosus]|uniref:Uncharacterized protein YukE n=1 Tax=Catenuloplanes atrovinosus TaxID=137266 RepID=A0AAE3YHY8_9ACTN|nr:hypothetical protein [Catenuloplanes atrovinosus]MDR7274268.1 uncharacterized protein YukE [Catenuloplanes atrovinosus]
MQDGQIKYDYAAMDDAYEEMLQVSKNMQSEIEALMDDARELLAASDGTFVTEYNAKAGNISEEFTRLNEEMSFRANQLQQMFSDMGVFDQKLGDGI